MRALAVAVTVALLPAVPRAADTGSKDPEPTIRALKAEEESLGFKPTGNFASADARVQAYYRCYYTGKLELPESYSGLKLRGGTRDGCVLDARKYDVFFYPIEAVASGHSPVTQALADATPERVATVVPHEDFHAQLQKLPDLIAEAAATLVGFLTADAAVGRELPLSGEASLFLKKAALTNRAYERLSAVYGAARRGKLSAPAALAEKENLFDGLQRDCAAIRPEPQSFNKCVSAPNNAGLAFDHAYTKFYPLLYRVFEACRRDLKCTTETIVNAPGKRSEAEAVRYFQRFADHSVR